MEAGGNAFDTGFVYGGGRHEKVLGDWIANRGVAKEVITIVKGAHTPYCLPRALVAQLDMSLERLGLDHAPVYIMHRDNLNVPVGEFVDHSTACTKLAVLAHSADQTGLSRALKKPMNMPPTWPKAVHHS